MSSRETVSFETPTEKHVLVLNAYITGREKRALSDLFISKIGKVNISNPEDADVDPSVMNEAAELAWKTVVVSIDGHTEGEVIEGVGKPFSIVEAILDMRDRDYNAVVKKVNEITNDEGFLEEGKS